MRTHAGRLPKGPVRTNDDRMVVFRLLGADQAAERLHGVGHRRQKRHTVAKRQRDQLPPRQQAARPEKRDRRQHLLPFDEGKNVRRKTVLPAQQLQPVPVMERHALRAGFDGLLPLVQAQSRKGAVHGDATPATSVCPLTFAYASSRCGAW